MNINDNDLVMVRFANDDNNPENLDSFGRQIEFKTWLRVAFIDIDDSLIGIVERTNSMRFTKFKAGDHVKVNIDQVLEVYNGGEFCYSDDVTICECKGLCRNRC